MKNLWKILILPFLVMLCLECGRTGTAEAAIEGVNYAEVLSVAQAGMSGMYGATYTDTYSYYVMIDHAAENLVNVLFMREQVSPCDSKAFAEFPYCFPSGFCRVYLDDMHVEIVSEGNNCYFTGLDAIAYCNYDIMYNGSIVKYAEEPIGPYDDGSGEVFTSVTLSAGGTEYTVKEPYPYYFVSYAYDSVRLFFTEEPFTAWWADLYTFNLYPGSQPVVCYHWSEEENNDFLSSRTTEALGLPYKHPASADYSSNYDVLSSKDSDRAVLPEKPLYPDVVTLYSAFTDEMLDYKHCIILRQEHEDALTNDVVCYLWNDSAANLIIRWGDSRIAAAEKGTMVTDYLAARYDLKTGTWNIDKNTPISRCNNEVYNVPYIYYSTADLYVQQPGQTGWYPSDMCVSAGSLEVPGFHPGIPTEPGFSTGIDWLDSLLKGLGNLIGRLFIPSSSFFQKKVDALTSRFSFWKSVYNTVDVFMDFLREIEFTEPPKVSLNLGNVKSKINYGSSAFVLDMSWYQPYKADVDVFLSAVLWLVFAWNTFKNLPNTIRGVGDGVFVGTSASSTEGNTKEGKK